MVPLPSPSSRGALGRAPWWWIVPALAAAAVAANTLANGFVYDDPIVLNWLRTRRWDVGGFLLDTRGLTYAVHALDHALWGEWAAGWHLTNALLHAAATALAAVAVRGVTGSVRAALAAGLVFAVHPVHAEVVANVTNRKDLLAMVCAAGALALWVRPGRGWLRALAASALLGLGLYAKEVAVATLPLGLLAADLLLDRQRSPGARLRRSLLHLTPLFVLAAVGTVLFAGELPAVLAPEAIGAKVDWAYRDLGTSLLTGLGNLTHFFRLLLFPRHLAVDYPLVVERSLLAPRVLLGVGGLVAWLGLAVLLARRAPAAALGLWWAVLLFLPCANLLPLHHILVAERYLYVPSFGLALALGVAFERAARAAATRPAGSVRRVAPAAVLLLVTGLGAWRSVVRHADWRDWGTLIAAADRDGLDTWRVHKSAGARAVAQGDAEEAVRRYRRALELRPGDPELSFWLAISLQRAGALEEAVLEYGEALRLSPDDPQAHFNRALALLVLGREPEAEADLRRTLELEPDYAPAHYHLGLALSRLERWGEALPCFRAATAYDPEDPDAWLNLGILLEAAGSAREALECYRTSARLEGANPVTMERLGDAAFGAGEHREAISAYRQLYGLRGDAASLVRLAHASEAAGDWTGAAGAWSLALEKGGGPECAERRDAALVEGLPELRSLARLQPDNRDVHLNLGRALWLAGDREAARGAWARALELSPGAAERAAVEALLAQPER